ncbi:MAG: hypothetical protein Q8P62_02490 [Candidatus Peregrinibacteria bacterium]|nr:hypothetical protein [Candidatus Peregrinibacteria bacterium]
MCNYIYVSKLDAAKRQLEMAIRLFLSNEEIVSTHTLAAAAHEILKNLCNKQEKESALKDTMLKMVKPERRDEFWHMLNDPENFFKHANKDPEGILKSYTGNTEMLLWDVCTMYQQLTNELPPLVRVYFLWYFSKDPDTLANTPDNTEYKNMIRELNLDPSNKQKFLEYLPYAEKIK